MKSKHSELYINVAATPPPSPPTKTSLCISFPPTCLPTPSSLWQNSLQTQPPNIQTLPNKTKMYTKSNVIWKCRRTYECSAPSSVSPHNNVLRIAFDANLKRHIHILLSQALCTGCLWMMSELARIQTRNKWEKNEHDDTFAKWMESVSAKARNLSAKSVSQFNANHWEVKLVIA